MTITKSDDFTGVTAGGSVGGRALNYALGGSGSDTWSSGGAGATGGGKVIAPTGGGSYVALDMGGAVNGKARVKFQYASASGNIRLMGRSGNANPGISTFGALLVGTTSLRIREFDGVGGSAGDKTTVTITAVNTSTDYYLEFEMDGTQVHARVFEADGTTQRGATASFTPGAYPTGQWWLFNEYFSGNNHTFDDFTFDDAVGGGGPILNDNNLQSIARGIARGTLRGVA